MPGFYNVLFRIPFHNVVFCCLFQEFVLSRIELLQEVKTLEWTSHFTVSSWERPNPLVCWRAKRVCEEFRNVGNVCLVKMGALFWQKEEAPLGSGVTEWWSLHLSVISSELASTRRWLPHFFPLMRTTWAGPDAFPPPPFLFIQPCKCYYRPHIVQDFTKLVSSHPSDVT